MTDQEKKEILEYAEIVKLEAQRISGMTREELIYNLAECRVSLLGLSRNFRFVVESIKAMQKMECDVVDRVNAIIAKKQAKPLKVSDYLDFGEQDKSMDGMPIVKFPGTC